MIPEFLLALPVDLIRKNALTHNVPWDVLAAIVSVESGGNAKAMRYEPGYKWLVNPAQYAASLNISHNTEIELQKFSCGLCQIMGATLRDMGYHGPLPLVDADANLFWGAKYLRILSNRGYDESQMISAYNAGSPKKLNGMFVNQKYVDKVYARLIELRKIG
jgi:soluble lytic murein transglycosylase-like protein